jgi:cyclophilin family peptidyl-prolyl cis-trans isomerase
VKKSQLVTLAVVALFIGVILFINRHEPARVSQQRKKEAAEAQRLVDEANGPKKAPSFQEAVQQTAKAALEKAAQTAAATATTSAAGSAEIFQVEFQCSNGTFIVEVHPEWSPLGAAQFRQAVEDGVYNEARFFRVIPGFIAQWGIPGDPEKTAMWEKRNIQDEPVKTSNVRGTITYAKSNQPNSRTIQLFINIGNNANLDGMGFSPFGKVVKGLEVVDEITSEYGEKPDQGEMESRGNAYLKEYFPKLDYIKEAKVLGAVTPAPPPASAAPADAAPAPALNQD